MPYRVQRVGDILEHHGIKGQKWGVRKGPPYPLEYDEHTGAEKEYNSKAELSKYDNAVGKAKNNKLGTVKKEYDRMMDRVEKNRRAREKDAIESLKVEKKAALEELGDISRKERKQVDRIFNERYNVIQSWNNAQAENERQFVIGKMMDAYGDKVVNKAMDYERTMKINKLKTFAVAGVLGAAATVATRYLGTKKFSDSKASTISATSTIAKNIVKSKGSATVSSIKNTPALNSGATKELLALPAPKDRGGFNYMI